MDAAILTFRRFNPFTVIGPIAFRLLIISNQKQGPGGVRPSANILHVVRFSSILLLFLFAIISAKGLGLDRSEASTRLQYHAMPVAISVLRHDWPYNYTANFSVAMAFQNPAYGSLADRIERVSKPDFPKGTGTYFWNVDDRGLADYVYLSALMFGPTLDGLFWSYFLILGVAVLAFMMGNWQTPNGFTFLVIYLAALGVSFMVWSSAPGTPQFGETSIHISESRLLGIMTILPIAHLFLFNIRRGPVMMPQATAVFVQIFVFIFLLHIRSSVIWQFWVLAILILCWVALSEAPRKPKVLRAIVSVFVMGIGIYGALPVYKKAVYHEWYFDHSGARTIWHNIVMGFGQSPTLSQKYQIYGDDASSIRAVIQYTADTAHQNNKAFPIDPVKIDAVKQAALNSLGSHNEFNWKAHEQKARQLALTIAGNNFWDVVKLYAYHKPLTLLSNYSCLFLTPPKNATSWGCAAPKDGKTSASIYPWLLTGAFLVFLISFVRVCVGDMTPKNHDSPTYIFATTMALGGMIPPLAFYPSLTTGGPWFLSLLLISLLFVSRAGVVAGEFSLSKILARYSNP